MTFIGASRTHSNIKDGAFPQIINNLQALIIFAESPILDV